MRDPPGPGRLETRQEIILPSTRASAYGAGGCSAVGPFHIMNTQPSVVSVIAPVSQALERVKRLLFQPFDLGRWFVIGFGAWLAHLGEQGFRSNYNYGFPQGGHGGGNLQGEWERLKDFVLGNLGWLVPLVVALLVGGLALGVLLTWLNSRGKFIFLHCVALDKAEVGEPWHQFAREGNSLFWFRLVLGLISMILTLPLVGLIVVLVIRMVRLGTPDVGGMALAAGAFLVLLVLGLLCFLIGKLTTDFVVPIMFLRRQKCLAGWRELRGLLAANFGNLILYLLFQIVLALVTGVLVLMVAIMTCCCCCLLVLPYVGTVLLLPVLVFKRAYSLHYLAQFGREFDVFPAAARPAV